MEANGLLKSGCRLKGTGLIPVILSTQLLFVVGISFFAENEIQLSFQSLFMIKLLRFSRFNLFS